MSALLAAVLADLIVQGYDSSTEDKTPVVLEGKENIEQHDKPPRVVFVPGGPGGDKFAPALNVGGNPQQRLSIDEAYVVHCWGKDYDAARALRNAVILALFHVGKGGGAFKWGTGGFTQNSPLMEWGKEYVFSVTVSVPVLEGTLQTVPGLKAAHTSKIQLPNGNETGCG